MIISMNIKGIDFYDRLFAMQNDLKNIGISYKGRSILNHGNPTNIMFLSNRLNQEFSRMDELFDIIKKPYLGKENIRITSTNIKSPEEWETFQLYHLIKIDIHLFFTLLRSLMDEFHRYILIPNIKDCYERDLKDEFSELYKAKQLKRFSNHKNFFNDLKEVYDHFMTEIRDTRDKLIHHSTQISLKRDPYGGYSYCLLPSNEIIELTGFLVDGDVNNVKFIWKALDNLNLVLDLIIKIFDLTIIYISNNYSPK